MGADQNLDWNRLAASTLDWWRDAGVDTLVGDAPFDWLAPPPAEIAAPPRRRTDAAPVAAPAPIALPATIDALLAWRAGDDAPEAAFHGARLAAAGPTDAAIMVMVDCPEATDCDALVGGDAGVLLDRMLAAIGLDRANVHLAAACATRPLARKLDADVQARIAEVARHHAMLVAPKRLLAMGDAASRAILGTDVRAARGRLHALNHKDGRVTQVVATHHPRFLLERGQFKGEAWRDLQLLVGGIQ